MHLSTLLAHFVLMYYVRFECFFIPQNNKELAMVGLSRVKISFEQSAQSCKLCGIVFMQIYPTIPCLEHRKVSMGTDGSNTK
jgi:hypothetical protein